MGFSTVTITTTHIYTLILVYFEVYLLNNFLCAYITVFTKESYKYYCKTSINKKSFFSCCELKDVY